MRISVALSSTHGATVSSSSASSVSSGGGDGDGFCAAGFAFGAPPPFQQRQVIRSVGCLFTGRGLGRCDLFAFRFRRCHLGCRFHFGCLFGIVILWLFSAARSTSLGTRSCLIDSPAEEKENGRVGGENRSAHSKGRSLANRADSVTCRVFFGSRRRVGREDSAVGETDATRERDMIGVNRAWPNKTLSSAQMGHEWTDHVVQKMKEMLIPVLGRMQDQKTPRPDRDLVCVGRKRDEACGQMENNSFRTDTTECQGNAICQSNPDPAFC